MSSRATDSRRTPFVNPLERNIVCSDSDEAVPTDNEEPAKKDPFIEGWHFPWIGPRLTHARID